MKNQFTAQPHRTAVGPSKTGPRRTMAAAASHVLPGGFVSSYSQSQPKPIPSNSIRRVRIPALQKKVADGGRVTMLTAYDALTAPIFEAAGVDTLLIGDSLGNVTLGYESTLPVSLEDIVRATEAVARSTRRPLIIADLPFGSFEESSAQAFRSSAALLKAGAAAVKLEGGAQRADTVSFLVANGVPVVGHLGYTPQSENTLGGPRLQGKGEQAARMLSDARALSDAGAFAIVLEMVPGKLAKQITDEVPALTIGIGAGPNCDGQVLVWSDMAGMTSWTPSFAKRFAELGATLEQAARQYVSETEAGIFPEAKHTREN